LLASGDGTIRFEWKQLTRFDLQKLA
jgi:hypothetical protein